MCQETSDVALEAVDILDLITAECLGCLGCLDCLLAARSIVRGPRLVHDAAFRRSIIGYQADTAVQLF